MWTGRAEIYLPGHRRLDDLRINRLRRKARGLLLLMLQLAVAGSVLITNTFDTETMTAYELGAKGYFFDRRLSV